MAVKKTVAKGSGRKQNITVNVVMKKEKKKESKGEMRRERAEEKREMQAEKALITLAKKASAKKKK